VLAYDWRQALGGYAVQPRTPMPCLADGGRGRCAGALAAGAGADRLPGPAGAKKLMPRLQQLLNRAQLTQEEVHILRGIARAVQAHGGSAA
jgi:tRNA/rRNA methyltransferase